MTAHYYCLLYDIVIYLSCKPIILLDGSYSLLLHIQPIFSRPSAPHKKLLYSEISSCSARSSPRFVGRWSLPPLRLKSSWPESVGAIWEAIPVPRRSRTAPKTEISSSELSPNFLFRSGALLRHGAEEVGYAEAGGTGGGEWLAGGETWEDETVQ